ncbi:transcriptional regulator YeiL [Bacillus tropicus]|uniref:Transcriptional regulator YeiL n=1 Tax=Bacillus tropicus TaxID=2026188 RepID=A0A5C4ZZZ8_9BACI|nr:MULTISPECIES: transcriptional regulator YeiL [Bacillus]AIE81846.1 putative N-ribosylNicotinamide CRP-like regulator [Bacillus cereus]AJH72333.1 cyclic nucleotide-binding domain protein [Bacillus cereus ATCC 4342]EEM19568.1 Cyclic nucleotide-binding domain protein [Bacillus thuringiensis serovar tochigiensis BGSC 4Y1]EEK81351.1 Cyclic nucleotide-binding domain protein [Bacillus cereus ATCC 4342]KAA0803078.1 transcriptional regulator YeiL [Bacillus sp. JAS102]
MKVSKNSEEISHYIQTYNFHTLFSFDILPYAELHSFQKSEKICNEGVDVPYLYYLISGKAKIYMSHKNGKTSLINFIQASSFIGELGLIGVESVTKTVEVIEDCMCLALPLKDCQHLLLQDVIFLQKLCKFIGEKTITRTESYAKNNSYPFENRLAAFILLTEQNNSYTEKHTEASEYLNVSYRHLLYVLNQFCQQNYLKKDGRTYYIQDRNLLEKLADELKI